jgi:hypothetical protein
MSRQEDLAAARAALEEVGREARAALRLVLAAEPAGADGLRAHAESLRRAADLVGEWADGGDGLADLLEG